MKIPFGIAQIGKAFRNEIVARQFIFRMREFEQMEMQFFVRPGEELKWFDHWRQTRMKWHRALGFGDEHYRFHDHDKLAHYANAATDVEFEFPFGFKEVEGIHSRTDFDLGNHAKFSGKKIQYYDTETGESYVPYVVETSIGVDRMVLQVLSGRLQGGAARERRDAYRPEYPWQPSRRSRRRFSRWSRRTDCPNWPTRSRICSSSTITSNTTRRTASASAIAVRMRSARRCITVDYQSLEDKTVTVRHRDSMQQHRVAIADLAAMVGDEVSLRKLFSKIV